jgi:hypothetical protein
MAERFQERKEKRGIGEKRRGLTTDFIARRSRNHIATSCGRFESAVIVKDGKTALGC